MCPTCILDHVQARRAAVHPRFAADERSATTLGMLAECFAELSGVPKVVLADRIGGLKGGVVANKVVPTADYVQMASHQASARTGAWRLIRSSRGNA